MGVTKWAYILSGNSKTFQIEITRISGGKNLSWLKFWDFFAQMAVTPFEGSGFYGPELDAKIWPPRAFRWLFLCFGKCFTLIGAIKTSLWQKIKNWKFWEISNLWAYPQFSIFTNFSFYWSQLDAFLNTLPSLFFIKNPHRMSLRKPRSK